VTRPGIICGSGSVTDRLQPAEGLACVVTISLLSLGTSAGILSQANGERTGFVSA
jgi:hypothetical protein